MHIIHVGAIAECKVLIVYTGHLSAVWPVDEPQSEINVFRSFSEKPQTYFKGKLKSTVSHFCCELSQKL